MPPVQEWSINTGKAYAGEQYGLATTNSQRLTFNAEAEMTEYGLAVQQGAKWNTCKPGHDSGEILGVVMRQNVLESATRPGDGTIKIPVGQPLGVMMSGPIMVKLATAITDENVGISATGHFGGVASGYTAATNVKALEYPAQAGDVVPVMITLAAPKP